MGIGFNWFKDYEIIPWDDYSYDTDCRLEYIGGDSTSHSAGNIIIVQDLLEKYGEIRIPHINQYELSREYRPNLINPKVMSEVCEKILENSDVDKVNMRDRIEWFKELSDDGYYLSYNLD